MKISNIWMAFIIANTLMKSPAVGHELDCNYGQAVTQQKLEALRSELKSALATLQSQVSGLVNKTNTAVLKKIFTEYIDQCEDAFIKALKIYHDAEIQIKEKHSDSLREIIEAQQDFVESLGQIYSSDDPSDRQSFLGEIQQALELLLRGIDIYESADTSHKQNIVMLEQMGFQNAKIRRTVSELGGQYASLQDDLQAQSERIDQVVANNEYFLQLLERHRATIEAQRRTICEMAKFQETREALINLYQLPKGDYRIYVISITGKVGITAPAAIVTYEAGKQEDPQVLLRANVACDPFFGIQISNVTYFILQYIKSNPHLREKYKNQTLILNFPGFGQRLGDSGGAMNLLSALCQINGYTIKTRYFITGTGTHDLWGNIGPVGGIYEKLGCITTKAKENPGTQYIFFIPKENYCELFNYSPIVGPYWHSLADLPSNLAVVQVGNIKEALTVLASKRCYRC